MKKQVLIKLIIGTVLVSGFVLFLLFQLQGPKIESVIYELSKRDAESKASTISRLIRNDLLSGNLRPATAVLEKSTSDGDFVGFKIISANGEILESSAGSVNLVDKYSVTTNIYFSEGGDLWGRIELLQDAKKFHDLSQQVAIVQFRFMFIFSVVTIVWMFVLIYFIGATSLDLDRFVSGEDNDSNAKNKLQDLFWGALIQKIKLASTESKMMQQKILVFQNELALSDLAKQVAHDIRSPLTALDFALAGVEMPEERKRILLGASARIKQIANDLLDQSRGAKKPVLVAKEKHQEAPREVTQRIRTSAGPIIKNIIEEKVISHPEINFQFNISDDLFVEAEPTMIGRMVSNILNNSIEALAGKEQATVEISAKKMSDRLAIYIQDNGKGIPEEVLIRIGESGFSYGKANGNGIGVSSAKAQLKMLGGDLQIMSKVDQGTMVVLTMPTI